MLCSELTAQSFYVAGDASTFTLFSTCGHTCLRPRLNVVLLIGSECAFTVFLLYSHPYLGRCTCERTTQSLYCRTCTSYFPHYTIKSKRKSSKAVQTMVASFFFFFSSLKLSIFIEIALVLQQWFPMWGAWSSYGEGEIRQLNFNNSFVSATKGNFVIENKLIEQNLVAFSSLISPPTLVK